MPEADQVELIDAHPRLGAPPASVSALSFVEQGYASESAQAAAADAETERNDVAAELDRLNTAYEARTGFRYCVFVAGRARADLLPDFRLALTADRDAELERALEAAIDIAADRWAAALPLPGRNDALSEATGTSASIEPMTELMPILIDCDTGIDDSLALLYAVASPEAELVAVTCCAATSRRTRSPGTRWRSSSWPAGRTSRSRSGATVPLVRPLETRRRPTDRRASGTPSCRRRAAR